MTMIWVEGIAYTEEIRNEHEILVGNLDRKKFVGKIDVDGRIILKPILKKQDGNTWIGFIWFVEELPSCCEHGDGLRGSVNGDTSP